MRHGSPAHNSGKWSTLKETIIPPGFRRTFFLSSEQIYQILIITNVNACPQIFHSNNMFKRKVHERYYWILMAWNQESIFHLLIFEILIYVTHHRHTMPLTNGISPQSSESVMH